MTDGELRTQRGAKRVRAVFGGRVVADTVRPLLVWEVPYYPAYYLPVEDVDTDLLDEGRVAEVAVGAVGGAARLRTVRVGERTAPEAAAEFADHPELGGHLRLHWPAMDAWFEEDEEVFTHPRDPGVRVDVLASSRHVVIEVGGEVVADSVRPRLLFETNLPTRYYLPQTDVRLDLLEPSATVTHCPYKGAARYFSVRAGGQRLDDVAWSYRTPLRESEQVAGLVCFLDERVDVTVDGVRQERPVTKFG